MKRNLLAKIIVPIIALGVFLAPISPLLKIENEKIVVATRTNEAEAAFQSNILTNSSLAQKNIGPDLVTLTIKIGVNDGQEWFNTDLFSCVLNLSATNKTACQDWSSKKNGAIGIVIRKGNTIVNGYDLSPELGPYFEKVWDPDVLTNWDWVTGNPARLFEEDVIKLLTFEGDRKITQGLTPETTYSAQLYFKSNDEGVGQPGSESLNLNGVQTEQRYYKFGTPVTFTTLKEGEAIQGDITEREDIVAKEANLGCNLDDFDLGGCIAEFFLIVWQVSSKIMELAGKLLDFFMYYSLNSAAYTSEFITKGWGIIRDIANIFFIIVLLYIAIKTILNLNSSNNKRLIGAIVIVALVINFSLFITKVVIDSSNILAKVFYNQISSEEKSGATSELGAGGEKQISVKLVSGFNPQSIVKTDEDLKNIGTGMYIFIILIMIALTLYTAYMFFVVSILFIGRIASLWVCMIFAPFAFVSYSVPFSGIPFHYKKWWKDLLESAFMAPLFIFFLYIIILFVELGKDAAIGYGTTSSPDTMLNIMKVIIPFAIIFIMLTRAKKLAQDFSGELGQMLSKVGGMATSFVGGGMVGFAAGALAKGGRATVGRAGSALAESKFAKGMASSRFAVPKFFGNKLMDVGKATATKSFDVRGLSVMGKTLASAGLRVGKAEQGGFTAARAEQIAKRQKRAQELKAGPNEKEVKDLRKAETDKQDLISQNKTEIETLDKTIERLTKELHDNKGINPDKARDASIQLQNVKDQKKALMEGRFYEGDKTGKKVKTGNKIKTGKQVEVETGNMIDEVYTTGLLKGKPTGKKIPEKKLVDEEIDEEIDEVNTSTAKDYRDNGIGELKDAKGNTVYQKAAKGEAQDSEGYRIDQSGNRIAQKKAISDLDKEIRSKTKAVDKLNRDRMIGYAKGMDKFWGKAASLVFSGGEHSGIGANEAAYRIRMDQKLDTGTKV